MRFAYSLTALTLAFIGTPLFAQEYLNGIEWKMPPIIQPGATDSQPPSDAIVLFDGNDLSEWENGDKWKTEDGLMISGQGYVTSKKKFGDCQVHIEWSAPTPPHGTSQGRGNSGIFLMGKYEMQILDSYDNETYFDGQAGAIYKQTPPMVNAMRAPGEWNAYEILWTCPRFNEDGSLKSPAYITAIHNGAVVLNHFELLGDNPYNRPPEYNKQEPEGPISLQDHGNPVRFRNIWVREMVPATGEQKREPFLRNGNVETPISK